MNTSHSTASPAKKSTIPANLTPPLPHSPAPLLPLRRIPPCHGKLPDRYDPPRRLLAAFFLLVVRDYLRPRCPLVHRQSAAAFLASPAAADVVELLDLDHLAGYRQMLTHLTAAVAEDRPPEVRHVA